MPDLSNQQPLGVACASAILAELGGRYGQPSQPLAPEVLAVIDQLRAVLGRCTMLDSPRKPEPVMRMVIDEHMPKIMPTPVPLPAGMLHPIHVQTIDGLVRQAMAPAEPEVQAERRRLHYLYQQAESVSSIMQRLKDGTLKGPAEPAPTTGTEAGSKDKHPLTVIYWRDSRQPMTEWQFTGKLPKFSTVEAQTVGFVVHEDEHTLAIAPTLASKGEPDEQVMGIVQIPKAAISHRFLLGILPTTP